MTHRPELWHRPGSLNGTLIVRLRPGVDLGHLDAHLAAHGAAHGQPVGTIAHRLHLSAAGSEALAKDLIGAGLVEYAEPDLEVYSALTPNDTNFSSQHPEGSNMTGAWDLTTGNPSWPVAVLDSGCDTAHEDMQANILAGWNVLNSNTDVTDNTGHGTVCCSIVGATTNNNLGVYGNGWNTKVVPVKITDSASALVSNIAAALDWVRLNTKCRIASISYAPSGGWGFSDSTLNTAINACWTTNIVNFFASGENNASVSSPTGNSNAVQVGAVTANHQWSSSISNYGPGVSFYAMGSTWAVQAFSQSGNENSYNNNASGSSAAAPLAAAIAALCLAANPGLSAQQIVTILSNPLNGFTGKFFPDSTHPHCLDASKCVLNARNLLPILTPCGRS